VPDSIRPASRSDTTDLLALLQKGGFLHRHLDWHEPLDWLERQPFLLIEDGSETLGFISCPEEPRGIIWVHCFYCQKPSRVSHVWKRLFEEVLRFHEKSTDAVLAAIPLSIWFTDLLQNSGFSITQQIVNLRKIPRSKIQDLPSSVDCIKEMKADDLRHVDQVDRMAFSPLWQLTSSSMKNALSSSYSAKVAVSNGSIIAYQISTLHQGIVHLARVAVLPEFHHKGVATALINDLESQCWKDAIQKITLNSQSDNPDSLTLYKRLGFELTGEEYPVFTSPIR
jgi:ribosomal protein S18 acetylase RimI-like enzyme